MSGKNLAALVTKYGEPLEVREIDIPTPGDGEVIVNILVRPVNPADTFSCNGVYPAFQPPSLPTAPGLEGMGKVHAIGNGVTKFKVGDRVVPILLPPRSFQEYVVAREQDVIAVPDDISNETACQMVVNPFTVWGMIEKANLKSGDFLVQSGASSEVGRMVIEAAKMRGIKTINLVRRKELVDDLLSIGGDYVICTADTDVSAKIKEITGTGAHAAFDCVTGDLTAKIQAGIRDEGIIIIYGILGGLSATTNGLDFLFRGVKVDGFWVAKMLKSQSSEDRDRMVKEVYTWMRQPHFGKHIGEKFALKDVNEAMKASLKDAKPGKVLLYNTI